MTPLEENSTMGIVCLDAQQQQFFFSKEGLGMFFEVLLRKRRQVGFDLFVPIIRTVKEEFADPRTDKRVLEVTAKTTTDDLSKQWVQHFPYKGPQSLIASAISLLAEELEKGGYRASMTAKHRFGRPFHPEPIYITEPEKLQPVKGEKIVQHTPITTKTAEERLADIVEDAPARAARTQKSRRQPVAVS